MGVEEILNQMRGEMREGFAEVRGEMKSGFSEVHQRVDKVQDTLNATKVEQARIDERLTAHTENTEKHRNSKSVLGIDPGVLKIVVCVCTGIGALAAIIVGVAALL